MPSSNNGWERLPSDYYKSKNSPQPDTMRAEPLPEDPEAIFEVEQPRRSLQSLIVSEVTKAQILAILAKIRHHHTLYVKWNLQSLDPYGGRTAINLYGPPGSGKSLCAEAIATELGKQIIRVNYAELESKYVGETSKNIKAAFAKAKKADAVLFFDEADSILGRRLTNVTQSADYSVNISRSVMLLELDRFEGTTIFATNLFRNYDGAFIRRILGHIEMPLPDKECRSRLWDLHLLPTIPGAVDLVRNHLNYLAEQSEELAGGDILNAVILAASSAVVREETECTVTLEDIIGAIAVTRKARQEAGREPEKPRPHITSTQMPIEHAPPDVQQAAQLALSEPE
ncbi:MAG TPA: ATP-binding protein [Ktedonobacteraceae bacterium]|nr:ATP-binding protein [Ktedonobacteraceae bacterium]